MAEVGLRASPAGGIERRDRGRDDRRVADPPDVIDEPPERFRVNVTVTVQEDQNLAPSVTSPEVFGGGRTAARRRGFGAAEFETGSVKRR